MPEVQESLNQQGWLRQTLSVFPGFFEGQYKGLKEKRSMCNMAELQKNTAWNFLGFMRLKIVSLISLKKLDLYNFHFVFEETLKIKKGMRVEKLMGFSNQLIRKCSCRSVTVHHIWKKKKRKKKKRVFTSHEPQWGSLPLPQWLMVIWEISFLAFLFSIGVSKLHSKIHKNAT